jgi:hypothetical protein
MTRENLGWDGQDELFTCRSIKDGRVKLGHHNKWPSAEMKTIPNKRGKNRETERRHCPLLKNQAIKKKKEKTNEIKKQKY